MDSRGDSGSQEDVYRILGRRCVDTISKGINACTCAGETHLGELGIAHWPIGVGEDRVTAAVENDMLPDLHLAGMAPRGPPLLVRARRARVEREA